MARSEAPEAIDLTSIEDSSTPELVRSIQHPDSQRGRSREDRDSPGGYVQARRPCGGSGSQAGVVDCTGLPRLTAVAALAEVMPAWTAFLIVSFAYLAFAVMAVGIALKKALLGYAPKPFLGTGPRPRPDDGTQLTTKSSEH